MDLRWNAYRVRFGGGLHKMKRQCLKSWLNNQGELLKLWMYRDHAKQRGQ